MTADPQTPGGWPDAVHMAATLSRAAHDHMQKRGLACCPHDIGIVLWKAIAAEVAAREAAARREGIEALKAAREVFVLSLAFRGRDAGTAREAATMAQLEQMWREQDAAIRALLAEGER